MRAAEGEFLFAIALAKERERERAREREREKRKPRACRAVDAVVMRDPKSRPLNTSRSGRAGQVLAGHA